MTLEEAIKHEENEVQERQYQYQECVAMHNTEGAMNCRKYAEKHRQLAEWLKDYKRLLDQEPCEDAISRQAVIDELNKWDWQELYLPVHFKENIIDVVPSVKPQEQKTDSWSIKDVADTLAKHGLIKEQNPKTGHWIKLFLIDTSDIDGQCSECGFIHRFIDGHTTQYDYCPNCGAKMESEVE